AAGFRQRSGECATDARARTGDERDTAAKREQIVERDGRHQAVVSNDSLGMYFASRMSAVRACASMPSCREMRAVTAAISRVASRDMRCQVTVLMNLPTERPPE